MTAKKTDTAADRKASARPRRSRVVEIAEDLRTVAEDTVKEAVETARKSAKKTTNKVKSATEKVGKEAGKTLQDVKETLENKKTIASELAGDAKTIIADTWKETGEKVESVTGKIKEETEKTAPAEGAEASARSGSDTKEKKKPLRGNKKRAAGPAVMIQSVMGGEIALNEILRRISEKTNGQAVSRVYIKAEENRAYYVMGDDTGYIDLWQ